MRIATERLVSSKCTGALSPAGQTPQMRIATLRNTDRISSVEVTGRVEKGSEVSTLTRQEHDSPGCP